MRHKSREFPNIKSVTHSHITSSMNMNGLLPHWFNIMHCPPTTTRGSIVPLQTQHSQAPHEHLHFVLEPGSFPCVYFRCNFPYKSTIHPHSVFGDCISFVWKCILNAAWEAFYLLVNKRRILSPPPPILLQSPWVCAYCIIVWAARVLSQKTLSEPSFTCTHETLWDRKRNGDSVFVCVLR